MNDELKSIAEHLGCNVGEFTSEVGNYISKLYIPRSEAIEHKEVLEELKDLEKQVVYGDDDCDNADSAGMAYVIKAIKELLKLPNTL